MNMDQDDGFAAQPAAEVRARQLPDGAAQVLARVTREMRDSLEREAKRTGRSISRVAENWMELGRTSSDQVQHALGGPKIAPTLLSMGRTYREMSKGERLTKADLIEAWARVAEDTLPDELPMGASEKRSAAALEFVRSSFGEMAGLLHLSPEMVAIGQEDWMRALWVTNIAISVLGQNLPYAERLNQMKNIVTERFPDVLTAAGEAIGRGLLSSDAVKAYNLLMKAFADAADAAVTEMTEIVAQIRGSAITNNVAAAPGRYTSQQLIDIIDTFLRLNKS